MATAVSFVAPHGLQTWALQVQTRIARQSEMETLNEMVTIQGDQWLDAYFDDLLRAGPHIGGIAELVKTPGKKREGMRTRAVASNAAVKNAKLVTANKNADKENAPLINTPTNKKTTRFQRALMAVKEDQTTEPTEVMVTPLKKPGRPTKATKPILSDQVQETIETLPSPPGPPEPESAAADGTKPTRQVKGKGKAAKKGKGNKKAAPSKIESRKGSEAILELPPVDKNDLEAEGSKVLDPNFADYLPLADTTATRSSRTPALVETSLQGLTPHKPTFSTVSQSPMESVSFIHPTISLSSTHETTNLNGALTGEDTLPEVEALEEALEADFIQIVTTMEEPTSIPGAELSSLSVIQEDDEAESPPASHVPLPIKVPAQSSVPSDQGPVPAPVQENHIKPPSPKVSQPSLDEFATAPLPTRPARITLGAAMNPGQGMPRASHANVGPPPVQMRPSVGLRSSWLTKALREDSALPPAPAATQLIGAPNPVIQQPASTGVKRKSSELEEHSSTNALTVPVGEEERTNKVRKIAPTPDKELSKSLRTEKVMKEEDAEETGILDRVRGKVEGLLVRADKEEDRKGTADSGRESSFSFKKFASRLSVSDLVSVFERRDIVPALEQNTSTLEPPLISNKAVEKGVELVQSTTPFNSPPTAPSQIPDLPTESHTGMALNAPGTKLGGAFAWASTSPSRSHMQPPSQESAPSQSTQFTGSTYVADTQNPFTQETAVGSQPSLKYTDGVKFVPSQLSRTNSVEDMEDVEYMMDASSNPAQSDKPAKTNDERYLFQGTGETSVFAQYQHLDKGETNHGQASQTNKLGKSMVSTDILSPSSASEVVPSQSSPGLFAQAGAFVSKALGMSTSIGPSSKTVKVNAQPVKSLALAAAAAKKEQMEKDRKAARAKEVEDRRVAAAHRKLEEEKAKEEEVRKAKTAELERRKREREEASAASRARLYKTKVSSDDESNKKRKLAIEAERKPAILKKAPSQDTLRKGMKTPTPSTGTSAILKSSKTGGMPSRPAAITGVQMNKSTSSTRSTQAGPSIESDLAAEAQVPPTKPTTAIAATVDAAQSSSSALKGGALRTYVMSTAKAGASQGQLKVKESLGDGRQPLQAIQAAMHARAQAQIQAAQVQVEEQARVASEQIDLPDIATEYSDSDDEDRVRNYTIPHWANSPELRNQLQAQSNINPDSIFGAIRPLHMDEIFRSRQSRFRARTSSANWIGQDRLTPQEEMDYARRMGFL